MLDPFYMDWRTLSIFTSGLVKFHIIIVVQKNDVKTNISIHIPVTQLVPVSKESWQRWPVVSDHHSGWYPSHQSRSDHRLAVSLCQVQGCRRKELAHTSITKRLQSVSCEKYQPVILSQKDEMQKKHFKGPYSQRSQTWTKVSPGLSQQQFFKTKSLVFLWVVSNNFLKCCI